MSALEESWNNFWFEPTERQRLLPIRIAVCSCVALWFASYWMEVELWFGAAGLLPPSLGAKMIAYEEVAAWEYWSPLWWFDQAWPYYAWISVGILVAITAASGFGGRWTVAVLLFWMLSWVHRLVWASGIAEPAMIAMVAYLIIDPGPMLNSRNDVNLSQIKTWQATTALRMLQTHWWVLLAATLLSQTAGIVWWRGEAVWWLASAGRSHVLTTDILRENPILVNGLTHIIIAIELLSLWFLTRRSTRNIGIVCGSVTSLILMFVADQVLYGAILGCGLLAFYLAPDSHRR